MRKPFLAGNWKMNMTVSDALDMVKVLKEQVADVQDRDIALCPNFTVIYPLAEACKGSPIAVGAQNIYWEAKGAFTGETSADMLKAAGATYVIIGHSERRQYFGETNETVNKRIKCALSNGLKVIMCCGEVLEEREAGNAESVVKDHLNGGLAGLSKSDFDAITIAYEPVWAIGTGKTATPDDADAMHAFIRSELEAMFDKDVAEKTRIQYGGSVKPSNVDELMAKPNIDGALVGGASLKAEDFARIITFKA